MGEKEPPVDPASSVSKGTLADRIGVLRGYRAQMRAVGDFLGEMEITDEINTEVYKASLPKLH